MDDDDAISEFGDDAAGDRDAEFATRWIDATGFTFDDGPVHGELIEGGALGGEGFDVARFTDGQFVVIATMGSFLLELRETPDGDWTWSEIIRAWGRYVLDVSVATDSQDHIHIAYCDSNFDIRYATNAGGDWADETVLIVALDSFVCPRTAITIDSKSHARVLVGAYHGPIYLEQTDAGWTAAEFDPRFDLGYTVAIAVDAEDHVHVAYDGDSYPPQYANNAGGIWQFQDIDDAGYLGGAMALDAAGVVHVTYTRSDGVRYYANNTNGAFQREVVDNTSRSGCAITFDPRGDVAIAYVGDSNLRYARRTGPAWEIEVLPGTTAASSGEFRLAFDGDGAPIVFHDPNGEQLDKIARDESEWISTTLPFAGAIYLESGSIAIDEAGTARLVYELDGKIGIAASSDSGLKKRAMNVGSCRSGFDAASSSDGSLSVICSDINKLVAWEIRDDMAMRTTLATGEKHYSPSIDRDDAGHSHVCGFDPDTRELKYWTNSSGEWTSEALPPGKMYEHSAPCIVLRAKSGVVNILYRTEEKVTHVFGERGSWLTQALSEIPDAGDSYNGTGFRWLGLAPTRDGVTYATVTRVDWRTTPHQLTRVYYQTYFFERENNAWRRKNTWFDVPGVRLGSDSFSTLVGGFDFVNRVKSRIYAPNFGKSSKM
ncbi:hypothetical protein K8I61_11850 [bacterium]|nr:hypothetical protein [bacterium]